MFNWRTAVAVAALAMAGAAPALADTYSGDLFYTLFTGGANVNKVSYSYDDATHSFSVGTQQNIAFANGADGIIFDAHGNLLVGGQGTGLVHMYDPATGALIDDGATPRASYHLALDPSGNYVYTSDFEGPLEVLPLGANSVGNATQHSISPAPGQAGDYGVTQVAYAPDTGKWFYVNGGPNGGGNLGTIDMGGTYDTTQLYAGVNPAHGLIFDTYTHLMTVFGHGSTGTFKEDGTGLKTSGSFACDFDQGATDGMGHALVAGCNGITFLDYRMSHDITHPDYVTTVGGFYNIDDVAPLSGLGSQGGAETPEPATLLLLGSGLAGGLIRRRRRTA